VIFRTWRSQNKVCAVDVVSLRHAFGFRITFGFHTTSPSGIGLRCEAPGVIGRVAAVDVVSLRHLGDRTAIFSTWGRRTGLCG
jgi:hypothetical protein